MIETAEPPPSTKPSSITNNWILLLLGFYLVWGLRATAFYFIDEGIASPLIKLAYGNLLRLLVWVLPVFLFLKYVDRVEPTDYLKLKTKMEAPILGFGLVFLYLTGILVFEYFASGRTIFGPNRLSGLTLLWLPWPPIAEEIFYRGFVLQKFRQLFAFWTANALCSLLFVCIHWPYWIYSGQPARTILVTSLSILPLSLMLGYLVKRTNSLYPALLLHLLNNFVASIFSHLK